MPKSHLTHRVNRILKWKNMSTLSLSHEITNELFLIFQLPRLVGLLSPDTSVEMRMTPDIIESSNYFTELSSLFNLKHGLSKGEIRYFRKLYDNIISDFIQTIQNHHIPDPILYPFIFHDEEQVPNSLNDFKTMYVIPFSGEKKDYIYSQLCNMKEIFNTHDFLIQMTKFITNQCYMVGKFVGSYHKIWSEEYAKWIILDTEFSSSMPSFNDIYDGNMLSGLNLIIERSDNITFFIQSFYKVFVLFQIKLSSNYSYENKYWKKFFYLTTTGYTIYEAHVRCVRTYEYILDKNSYSNGEFHCNYTYTTKYPICFIHYVINEPFINYPVKSIRLTYCNINLLLYKILDQYLSDIDVIYIIGENITKVNVLV